MPRSGGAIQAAILPGSITRCIRLLMKARSPSEGSQPGSFACLGDEPVPALHADLAVAHIGGARRLVHGVAQRHLLGGGAALAVGHLQRHRAFAAEMVGEIGLVGAALDAGGEIRGRIRGDLGAEQVERRAEPEVQVFLHGRQVDGAGAAHGGGVVAAALLHHLERAPHHAGDAGIADEHVVRLFGQHELAGARQRIEAALGEALQLELAVAVGEIGEHEERQPVADRLVEGAEDARLVGIARMARQQLLRLLAPVAAEIGVQHIDHRPEMAALLDIDLEEAPPIVERRAAVAEEPLLRDRGPLGNALRDDEAAQGRATLARQKLPRRLAVLVAEADAAVGHGVGEEDAPAVIRHLHRAVARPALGVDRGRRAQIDVGGEEIRGPHAAPPIEEARLPMLQRALQRAVLGEVDVVGDALLIVDGHQTLSRLNCGLEPLPKSFKAPFSPTALGRLKIQFCQAERRPKMRVSMVSGPAKRRLASRPLSASGDRLARSSTATRISSSQSSASGAKVTRPSDRAASATRCSPWRAASAATGASSPQNRVWSRVSPFGIGNAPKFAADSATRGASLSPSGSASMKERSAASASSSSVPAKHDSRSMRAKKLRAETSSRARVRRRKAMVSRTNQCCCCASIVASLARSAATEPRVLRRSVPSSSSLMRSMRSASSSSRAMASGHQLAPWRRIASGSRGPPSAGPVTVMVAVRAARSNATSTLRSRGGSVTPWASAGRSLCAASACARSLTSAAKRAGGAAWSMSFHCLARSARTPSAVVQKTSARSRRTLRLSTRRVRPPVPGSTPKSGTSGRLTVEERSSTMTISSQASATS